MKRWLVTGAAGFIGSNFVRQTLACERNVHVIAFDALTYAGNIDNLSDCMGQPRLNFVRGDICDPRAVADAAADGVDVIVHFAAESHVDRSILGCAEFIRTNVQGTHVLLEYARRAGVERFIQISTDEVYGSLGPTGRFTETSPLRPNSPYSASKASADLLARAYHRTYGVPAVITRCSNNYGPYQFPEKLIPLFVTNLLTGKKVPVYGDGMNVRDWIHVEDHCRAIRAVIARGRAGEVYNIGGGNERTNMAITRMILAELGCDDSMIEPVRDRPAHDRRYAVDFTKIRTELGWQPTIDFGIGLRRTIQWYREHIDWWRAIQTGAYMEYIEAQYGTEAR